MTTLPLTSRVWLAWLCFFRIFFDGAFAAKIWDVRERELKGLPAPEPVKAELPAKVESVKVERAEPVKVAPPPPADPALQLLAIFQREGRLVDFLEQDVASFSDADVGAAARVVHEGCRKALHAHAKLAPVRSEEEGARVTIDGGYKPAEVKLSGNVQGAAPYRGVLRHRGWRATEVTLPTPVQGYDPSVLAPAEVEL